jgi:hypothetical protein
MGKYVKNVFMTKIIDFSNYKNCCNPNLNSFFILNNDTEIKGKEWGQTQIMWNTHPRPNQNAYDQGEAFLRLPTWIFYLEISFKCLN